MKLTKETAIILTYQLWKWMQDNGEISKLDWPGWKKYGEMNSDCPCCEHTSIQSCITDCPLIEIWMAKKESTTAPCLRRGSPYHNFDWSLPNKRANAVNKMVSAIEGEMKRLGIKNREIKP